MSRILDLTGQRFGRWTAVERTADHVATSGRRYAQWLCRCDCGNIRAVDQSNLRCGNSSSCGCCIQIKHGHARKRTMSPTYTIWAAMRSRCTNPRSPVWGHYGGRGIKVCAQWLNDFSSFLQDMGEQPKGLTLDRIDNDGDYCPENCRWTTMKEQTANRRCSIWIDYQGDWMPLSEAGRLSGISSKTLSHRYLAGKRGAELFAKPRPTRTSQVISC
jgi:hypothetical protein